MKITQILQTLFFVLVLALLLGGSTSIPPDQQELVRRITRPV
jgi:preprotein translocase subunit SecG